jgi:peptidoglycan/LPS O-acetylase OafA/YrhL
MTNREKFYQRLESSEIPALNGIRFIAVFFVIFYHLDLPYFPGGHGVMLFFVLSGFLITWLLLKENAKTSTISLGQFFKRRVLRIFPAFYAYWLIAGIFLIATRKVVPWNHAISAFFYYSNYFYAFNPESNNLFSHTWSLSIEEQFYLCFPFLFFLFKDNLKALIKTLGVIICSVWIWRFILVYGFDTPDSYIYCAFDTRIDHLLIGCFLAVALRERYLTRFLEFALKNSWMPVLTIILIVFSVSSGTVFDKYKDTIGFIAEPVLMSVLIVQLILFSSDFWWKWLDWRPIKYLGTISYSLYLYQQLTLNPTTKVLSSLPMIIQMIGAICVTVIAASLSYYLIEKPFLRFRNAKLQK